MAPPGDRADALGSKAPPAAGERLLRLLAALPDRGDDARAVLNGLFGDTLAEQGSRLATPMTVRTVSGVEIPVDHHGLALAFPDATPRICVLVHGLMSTESIWRFPGDRRRTYGEMLGDEHGTTAVYIRYNTGRHISTNGRELATVLQRLVRAWPVRVREIDLVGHSMGGLVIRSACHYGRRGATFADRFRGRGPWPARVRRIVLLGVPNGGAKLEVIANLTSAHLRSVPTPVTRLIGAGIDRRSDGIKDLRWGSVLDEDWIGRDPRAVEPLAHARVRVPRRAVFLAIAGSLAHDRGDDVHPVNRVLGDALVTTSSAHGHADEQSVLLPNATLRLCPKVNHLALAHHADVYDQISAWWNSTFRPR